MPKRLIITILLVLTPRRWRASIAGDFEEMRAGALATLMRGAGVLARLWIEELSIRRAVPMRQPRWHGTAVHLRQAMRSIVRRPAYSLIVIATLAVGIGANAAVFGLANWLMLREIPAVHEPGRLSTIRLTHQAGSVMTVSHLEMRAVDDHAPATAAIAGSMEAQFNIARPGGDATRVNGGIVSANYFEVLGVRPFAGRAFSDHHPGIVISHAFWRRQLASADIIGATLLVNGQPQPVLGIGPEGFAGTSRSSSVDIWVPTTVRAALFGHRANPLTNFSTGIYVELLARIAPGATADTVRAQVAGLHEPFAKLHQRPMRYRAARFVADEGLSSRGFERERLARIFALLLAMVGLLLLLACANVGNVMLAAGAARRGELATRQALGASRWQIVRAILLESLLLALAGGLIAIALAWIISAAMRGTIVLPFLPALGEITIDARVFAFAMGASTLAALAAGLLPALSATRFDLIATLKGSGRSVTRGGRRIRSVLTVTQVAVSLTLLVGALLLARSVTARRHVEPGFNPDPLLTFSIEPGLADRTPGRLRAFYATVVDRVREIPGVEAAALGWSRPFGLMADTGEFKAIDGVTQSLLAMEILSVGSGYLETMGIPLVAGREFTLADIPPTPAVKPRVAMISESAARTLYGSPAAALGRTIEWDPEERYTIVGVAGNARLRRAFESAPDALYRPLGHAAAWATVHVRSAVAPNRLAPLLRAAVRDADPTVPLYDHMTVREAIDRQMAEEILVGRLASAFAIIATLLAAVGLYGVLAQSVTDRRVEIGIRAALGATRARVLHVITSEAFWMTGAGGLIGIGLSVWLTRYLESRLFGVARVDPLTFAVALGIIALVAAASTIVPALRAARVDPVVTLRQ
jgi:predicted permease